MARIPDVWGRWICCGPGWYPILAGLDERPSELDPNYEVNQIEEKFGTLRFYWEGDIPDGIAIVDEAEAASAQTCERCGSPGRLRVRASWYKTLCDKCADANGYTDVPLR